MPKYTEAELKEIMMENMERLIDEIGITEITGSLNIVEREFVMREFESEHCGGLSVASTYYNHSMIREVFETIEHAMCCH